MFPISAAAVAVITGSPRHPRRAVDPIGVSHPPPPPGAERRQHPRAPVEAAVSLSHGDLIVLTSIVDASLGGAFVAAPDDLVVAVGDLVVIDFGKTKRILQEARVVRVVAGPPRGFAVAWREASRETLAALRALLPMPRPRVKAPAPAYTAGDVRPRSHAPAARGKVHHARGRKEAAG